MPHRFTRDVLAATIAEVERLRDEMLLVEQALDADLQLVPDTWRPSARNLTHYLALRNRDLRELQRNLAALGLSSLGRAEPQTLASIDAVLAALHKIQGTPSTPCANLPVDFHTGPPTLAKHTVELLGDAPDGRSTHVMVTMPSEAAVNPQLVRALLRAGTNSVRINCAHDDPAVWARIAENVRSASREFEIPCRILMDLPGPKLRTAGLPDGPRTLHVRPERGPRGEVVEPARIVWFRPGSTVPDTSPTHERRVPLEGPAWSRVRVGDHLTLRDLRGRIRTLQVSAAGPDHLFTEVRDSAWIETGLEVQLVSDGIERGRFTVGELPATATTLALRRGDRLWVVPEDAECGPATGSTPARIGCTLPEVFRDVREGESIHFDDGKISGTVQRVVSASAGGPRLEVEITAPVTGTRRLGVDKGINLPQTQLLLPSLTAHDLTLLEHVARHADMVGMSFVQTPADVRELEDRMSAHGRDDIGIVLKIETARAFAELPRLILTGLRSPPIGVMVARGDLGVELGFERLAEVQEEILWLCEAAHVPVIWATQVLESLAKRGQPSRAEVTDAAMSARAECVMLNKGPYVLEAVRFLDDVLRRMQDHQHKKFSTMRRLSVSRLAHDALASRSEPKRIADPLGSPGGGGGG